MACSLVSAAEGAELAGLFFSGDRKDTRAVNSVYEGTSGRAMERKGRMRKL